MTMSVGGEFTLAVTFRNVEDHFTWTVVVSMTLILLGIEGFSGMSWLACLGMIIMSPSSPVRD